jgi:hypothetical protein
MEVWVTGYNFESWPFKDHSCHVCFKLTYWFRDHDLHDLHPRWPPSAEDLMGKNVLKSSPLKPVSQFKANMAWIVLKWSILKIVSSDSHLGWRSWSPDTILKVLPKNYPCHVCIKLADWFQKRRLEQFSHGSYVKTMSADGGHFESGSTQASKGVACTNFLSEWVDGCCLTPIQQIFSYIMAGTS